APSFSFLTSKNEIKMKSKIHEHQSKYLPVSNAKSNQIKAGLQQFCGTETFYSIPLIQTRFTDGLKFLADEAECYWLITDVSVIAKSLMDKSYFVTVDFKRLSPEEREEKQCEAIITYGDDNGKVLETHRYAVTDFPLDELRL